MMATFRRRGAWMGVLLGAALCSGCNVLAMPFFLLPGMEPKVAARYKIAPKEKDKEVRVIILASAGLETRPELLRVDRELSRKLAAKLEEGFKKNSEKVTIIPTSRVEKYKDDHPSWKTKQPEEIGRYFRADYVIDLEINSISLYQQGSYNQMFRGRAEIAVDVVDVNKPSEGPVYHEEYGIEYPKVRGPQPVDGANPAGFRDAFLSYVARELSWRFTAHLQDDEQDCN
jgi:hypothetical protein